MDEKSTPSSAPRRYGIRKHVPVRRRSSMGPCDLCGIALDETEVHTTEKPHEIDHTEGTIARHTREYFDVNEDGTLSSIDEDVIDVEPVDRKALPPKAGG